MHLRISPYRKNAPQLLPTTKTSPFRRIALAASAAAVLLHAGTAEAAIAVSNLANPLNGAFSVQFNDPDGFSRAQQFTTGSIASILNSVTLSMNATGVVDAGTFHVDLYSSSASSLPDQPLLSLDGTTNPSATSLYTYTAPTSFQLAASTTYWIVASIDPAAPTKFYNWEFTIFSAVDGQPGWSMGASSIGHSFLGGATSWSGVNVPLKMEITATPVPEPAAWGTAILGVGLLSLLRPRRISRPAP